MAFVVPVVGEIEFLKRIVGLTASGNMQLCLFQNDYVPDESTTIASLTECVATGYARITLTTTSWTTAQVSGQSTASYPEQTFTITTSATVFGYYLLDASNNLLLAERFGTSAFILPAGGGQIAITPTISLE
jgi:hypothetical protein